MDDRIKHHTFVFERRCKAGIERVFAAFSDPVERARWSTPSETAAFLYDANDFREGGQDVFRCGSREAPQFKGVTTYISIMPSSRIVSSEVVESGGQILMANLITTLLSEEGSETRVRMTVQVTSFCGDEMLQGTEAGNNASLDNLVQHLAQ
ncbi:MAG: SRPBCC domain-containing protein [Proteobacteria bacterium]|nr:SRPBCC domain-containing protein [Pseudomonadota bacterium]